MAASNLYDGMQHDRGGDGKFDKQPRQPEKTSNRAGEADQHVWLCLLRKTAELD